MSEDPNLFRITISDTGRGIEEKNKSKLFKQFCKLDLGTADSINPQGVGLGLVISNALAKLLGQKETPGKPKASAATATAKSLEGL